jgi:hypothetical protein
VRVITDTTKATADLDSMGKSTKSLGDKFDTFGGHSAKISGGIGDIGGSLAAFSDASKLAASKADDQARALLAVQDAQDAFNKAVQDFGPNSKEAQKAQLDLNQAQRDAEPPTGIAEWGDKLSVLSPIILGAAGAMDLLTFATNALSLSNIKSVASSVASKVAMVAGAAATGIATAAQWAFNLAASANPVMLVVLAIAALVAGIIYLATQTQFFQTIFAALGDVFTFVKDVFVEVFGFIKTAVVAYFNFYVAIIKGAINGIMAAWDFIKGIPKLVSDVFDHVLGFLNSLPQRFLDLAKNIMQGLVDGINAGLNWVKDKIKGLANLLPDWLKSILGIHSHSTVMRKIGSQAVLGLADGLTSQTAAVDRAMAKVAAGVSGADISATADLSLSAGASGGAGTVINVTVNAPVGSDPAEIGRELERLLSARKFVSGRLAFQ